MTPKEKAKNLILKFAFKGAQHEGEAKQFALIAVDLLFEENESLNVRYWLNVKQEIEKL